MKIPWNSCKTWRKNYKNFRQIICKQQAKPRNIYMWWSRKFIKSKEKFVWCILQKLNNRTVSCRGLFHIAFPLIFNGSSVFMKYSICQTLPRKKNHIWQEMSPEFFANQTSLIWQTNMLSKVHQRDTKCLWSKNPTKKQNQSGFHLYCMETKNTFKKDVYFCNS